MVTATEELISQHYEHLTDKPFFPQLVQYMTSGPMIAGIIEGPEVIKSWRDMMGATNPVNALPGTIRGDFATAPVEELWQMSFMAQIVQKQPNERSVFGWENSRADT